MANENDQIYPFSLLPEGCIAHIVSFTSPGDACRAAAVSLGLKSGAESDVVWERFLPPDYGDVIARSVSPVHYSTKKELYFLLCDSPLLIDGGKLSFWLTKPNGKKCYMLCARELQIAWKDTHMYWKWTSLPESRFSEVAELLSVCWLDIHGTLQAQMLSSETNYATYLVFKLSEDHYGLHTDAKVSVKFVREGATENGGQISTACIVPETSRNEIRRGRLVRTPVLRHAGDRVPRRRSDGWMELELGEFYNSNEETGDIQMSFREIEYLNWKKGLIVEGIELRPK